MHPIDISLCVVGLGIPTIGWILTYIFIIRPNRKQAKSYYDEELGMAWATANRWKKQAKKYKKLYHQLQKATKGKPNGR